MGLMGGWGEFASCAPLLVEHLDTGPCEQEAAQGFHEHSDEADGEEGAGGAAPLCGEGEDDSNEREEQHEEEEGRAGIEGDMAVHEGGGWAEKDEVTRQAKFNQQEDDAGNGQDDEEPEIALEQALNGIEAGGGVEGEDEGDVRKADGGAPEVGGGEEQVFS